MLAIVRESINLIKNNILFSIISVVGIIMLNCINQLGYPIYQNILYVLSLIIFSVFIIRYLQKLHLFDFKIYFTTLYVFVLLFLLLTLIETIVIMLLFLPAEIMYFKYLNFDQWSSYIFENYLINPNFMQFIKINFILSLSFFSSIFLIKLTSIASNKQKSLIKIFKSSYQFLPLLMTIIILLGFVKQISGIFDSLLFLLIILGNQINKKIIV